MRGIHNHLRIIVTGSRFLPQQATRLVAYGLDLAAERYGPYAETATIVHGACSGADQLADTEAARRGWDRESHRAKWHLGANAGPARNRHMVRLGANVCIVYPGGDGTAHCARTAKRAGIPLLRIDAAEATDRNGLIMITDTGRLRCISVFRDEQCIHQAPHPRSCAGLHRSVNGTRWTMSHDGNTPTEYFDCPATWDDGRQCRKRAGHDERHHVGGNRPGAIRWNDTRSHITRGPLSPPEPDNGYQTEGEYQAMRLYGIE